MSENHAHIYDQRKLREYEEWVQEKRQGISKKTARQYAQMMLRSEKEGLTTMDDVYNKYWSWGHSVRTGMRNGIHLREEFGQAGKNETRI